MQLGPALVKLCEELAKVGPYVSRVDPIVVMEICDWELSAKKYRILERGSVYSGAERTVGSPVLSSE